MDIYAIRLQNVRQLVRQHCAGKKAAFARRLEKSDTQVNQLIGPTPKKNIGARIARDIERRFKLPVGWLDNIHEQGADTFTPTSPLLLQVGDVRSHYTSQSDEDVLAGYNFLPDELKTAVWDIIDSYMRRTIPGYASMAGPRNVPHSKRAEARLTTRQIIEQARLELEAHAGRPLRVSGRPRPDEQSDEHKI